MDSLGSREPLFCVLIFCDFSRARGRRGGFFWCIYWYWFVYTSFLLLVWWFRRLVYLVGKNIFPRGRPRDDWASGC